MIEIFVNLKRFEVPKKMGGVCLDRDPGAWISRVIRESVELGLGKAEDVVVIYLVPEALVISALKEVEEYPDSDRRSIKVGCQGVFRENVKKGGNFGAFTTNLPAAAARNLGCYWSIIGHSEERKDKLEIIAAYDHRVEKEEAEFLKARAAVNGIVNMEVICALESGIDVLVCIGEMEKERGGGNFKEQKPRIEKVLRNQIKQSLKGIEKYLPQRKVVIGYEPVWAIGPGKTPPGAEYIGFASSFIKETILELFDKNLPVVYGGGLKGENAAMIAGIETIDGGLVALTCFTGEIGFEPSGLARIIEAYRTGLK